MNLPAFLQKTDKITSLMTRDQLIAFVHETARVLPERERNSFLARLGGDTRMPSETKKNINILDDIQESIETLQKINGGEGALDSEYNEEYDDWYNSDVPECIFYDPDDLLPDVSHAISLLHSCVDQELYSEGYELAEALSSLQIEVNGDYADYEDGVIDVLELYENDLLEGSEEDFMRESLFLAYMGNKLEDRPEQMLRMMNNYDYYQISLEQILQMGSHELPDFEKFLPLWISALAAENSHHLDKYLEEAQSMLTDRHEALENARRYAKTHPELYLQYLQDGKDSIDTDEIAEMFEIGMEALGKIPQELRIRGRIALLAASYVQKMNNPNPGTAEYCWREAFYSDPTVVNFLRVQLFDLSGKKFAQDIRSFYEEKYKENSERSGSFPFLQSGGDSSKNGISYRTYCWLLFWDRRFDDVIRTGMKTKEALGWSQTFMKEGLAGFTLLLYRGTERPKGINRMLDHVVSSCGFTLAKFEEGMDPDKEMEGQSDMDAFWKLIQRWKAQTIISETFESGLLKRINKWISMRVTGIVGSQKRNYYWECAAFIAAYGEVLESMELPGARFTLMKRYQQQFPRHRAFRDEMRYYERGV